MPQGGELACLGAAALWAFAVGLFRPAIARAGATTVNLMKCGVAAALLWGTVLALGRLGEVTAAPGIALLWIAASGLLGLSVGDSALFAAVHHVGSHRTLLFQTLSPLFTAATAWTLTDERLPAGGVLGGAIVLVGVLLVVGRPHRPVPGGGRPLAGYLFATLAAAGQGVGVVLAKTGMADLDFLPATAVRLSVAALGLLCFAALRGRARVVVRSATDRTLLRRVVPATLLGTYFAMTLMMLGIALAPASLASVLLSTTPIFSLVFEGVSARRWPTPSELVGTLLAVVGVGVLSSS